MNISTYRRWYEITYCQPHPLTDTQLMGYPYYLNEIDDRAHAETETRTASVGGVRKSPLTITSGLLFYGRTNHD